MENNKKYNVNYVKVATEMAKFVEEKDTLYGNALFNMLDEYGMNYALSKITEKLFRLKQLKKLGKEDHSESFLDSLKDIWGYSFLTIIYLEQIQNQEDSNVELDKESVYDKLTNLKEDNKHDENDDDLSIYYNKFIEESESLLEDYERSIKEFDNNIQQLKNKINNNEKDISFSNAVTDAQDVLKMKMESLKAEYSERLSSLSDKICNLKSIDINDDEESYCFSGEEYNNCKEYIEENDVSSPLEIAARLLKEKVDLELAEYFSDIEKCKNEDIEESHELESEEEMKKLYSKINTDVILGMNPWECENNAKAIYEAIIMPKSRKSKNNDFETLRKNNNFDYQVSSLLLQNLSSNPCLLSYIPTDNKSIKLEEIISKKIDEIIRNNFGK